MSKKIDLVHERFDIKKAISEEIQKDKKFKNEYRKNKNKRRIKITIKEEQELWDILQSDERIELDVVKKQMGI
jgi:hypothetical protein